MVIFRYRRSNNTTGFADNLKTARSGRWFASPYGPCKFKTLIQLSKKRWWVFCLYNDHFTKELQIKKYKQAWNLDFLVLCILSVHASLCQQIKYYCFFLKMDTWRFNLVFTWSNFTIFLFSEIFVFVKETAKLNNMLVWNRNYKWWKEDLAYFWIIFNN